MEAPLAEAAGGSAVEVFDEEQTLISDSDTSRSQHPSRATSVAKVVFGCGGVACALTLLALGALTLLPFRGSSSPRRGELSVSDRAAHEADRRGSSLLDSAAETFLAQAAEEEMRRQEEETKFKIKVVKATHGPFSRLGISGDGEGHTIKITALQEGLIAQWNMDNPARTVVTGDCIVDVNGVHGNSSSLQEAIKASDRLTIEIHRPEAETLVPSTHHGRPVFRSKSGDAASGDGAVALPAMPLVSLRQFKPVDGGVGRACRARSQRPDGDTHDVLSTKAESLADCAEMCSKDPGCRGIEYADAGVGRCFLWRDLIIASMPQEHVLCLERLHHRKQNEVTVEVDVEAQQTENKTAVRVEHEVERDVEHEETEKDNDFQPVDGGAGRGCQHDGMRQPFAAYFTSRDNVRSLRHCKALCRRARSTCTGVEFRAREHVCRLWTQRIDTSMPMDATWCLRRDPEGFLPLGDGGGKDTACSPALDSAATHREYSLVLGKVSSLYSCKVHCVRKATCSGIEYREDSQQCKVWMLAIGAGRPAKGVRCFRYEQMGFRPLDGGTDRVCRGERAEDRASSMFLSMVADDPLYECKVHCARTDFCTAISYTSGGLCEVWTHAVRAAVPANGSVCLGFSPPAQSSLFCFSLTVPWTGETELLELQVKDQKSIFACEDFAVYSNPQLSLGGGLLQTRLLPIDLHCKKGGAYNTYLNTPIFRKLWEAVLEDGQFKSCAWTVKADPDSVFFPWRLRTIVQRADHADAHQHKGMYLNNCPLGLHGPLEVLNRRAVEVYAAGFQRCSSKPLQEDTYIQQCLDTLGVKKFDQWDLLAEAECSRAGFVKDPGWQTCQTAHASFHPFKHAGEYESCIWQAEHSSQWH